MMTVCFQRNTLVEAAPLQEEVLLFHPATNKFCILNRTAAFVWECLESPSTAEQLVEKLNQSFADVTSAEARQDVQSLLQEMQSLEFVVSVTQAEEEA
jgi:hypothetical protein